MTISADIRSKSDSGAEAHPRMTIGTAVVSVLLAAAPPAVTASAAPGSIDAAVIRVYDGDTYLPGRKWWSG